MQGFILILVFSFSCSANSKYFLVDTKDAEAGPGKSDKPLAAGPGRVQNEFVEGEDYACYVDENGVPHCDSPETLRKHFDKHTEKIQNEEFVEGEDSDTKDVDTKDSDTKDVDPKDSDTKDVDTKDSDSKDYD